MTIYETIYGNNNIYNKKWTFHHLGGLVNKKNCKIPLK